MNINIFTCNNLYDENGSYVSSYHEIHEINNLQNESHIIDTINMIIKNNTLYKSINDKLQSVVFICNDSIILENVIKYFEENPSIIEVIGAETAYMNI